jgi:hypothetical protein
MLLDHYGKCDGEFVNVLANSKMGGWSLEQALSDEASIVVGGY